jgi:hypothetical protein
MDLTIDLVELVYFHAKLPDRISLRQCNRHIYDMHSHDEFWKYMCFLEYDTEDKKPGMDWKHTCEYYYDKCTYCMYNLCAWRCIGTMCGGCCDDKKCKRHRKQQKEKIKYNSAFILRLDTD